jgi:adenine-specific DNA-methyltransferase
LFSTPKPEKLIKYILTIASKPNDLILDSFLGSGTTAAVAHKMGRRYIGIEMGEHAVTLCVPRLKKVVDGEQGGISNAVDWKGGGGFRFYRLGEPLFDETGVINPAISFDTLAAHIWFYETHTPFSYCGYSPFLGEMNGKGYYLLFNGVLGDKKPEGGNVLTKRMLRFLPTFDGPKVIYGEVSLMNAETLKEANIEFKKIPNQLQAR